MRHLKQCLAHGMQSVKDSCNYHTYFISSLPQRKGYFSPFIQGQSRTYISEHVSPTYITNIHWALVCQVLMQMLRIQRWTRQKFYQPLCPCQLSLPTLCSLWSYPSTYLLTLRSLMTTLKESSSYLSSQAAFDIMDCPLLPEILLLSFEIPHTLLVFSSFLFFSSYSWPYWAIKCGCS